MLCLHFASIRAGKMPQSSLKLADTNVLQTVINDNKVNRFVEAVNSSRQRSQTYLWKFINAIKRKKSLEEGKEVITRLLIYVRSMINVRALFATKNTNHDYIIRSSLLQFILLSSVSLAASLKWCKCSRLQIVPRRRKKSIKALDLIAGRIMPFMEPSFTRMEAWEGSLRRFGRSRDCLHQLTSVNDTKLL